MKLRPFHRRPDRRANVVMLVIVITACLTLATIAYVRLIVSQNSYTVRSQAWNNCMPLVEAVIEDAMGHLTTATNANLAASGWAGTTTYFSKTNALGDGYYAVSVNCSNLAGPVI